MFLRFITSKMDPDSHAKTGVFNTAYEMRDSGRLPVYEVARLREHLAWFAVHLAVPTDFSRTQAGRQAGPAIAWFKDTAHEHLQRFRQLVAILREHDVPVEMIKTDNPGYVVYEDEHQVVAEPFSDTRREAGA